MKTNLDRRCWFSVLLCGPAGPSSGEDGLEESLELADGDLNDVVLRAEANAGPDADEDGTEVEKTALRKEELDKLIDRYPVPAEWGDEPGWSESL